MHLVDFLQQAKNLEYLKDLKELCLATDQSILTIFKQDPNLNIFANKISSCINLQSFILEFSFIGVYKDLEYKNLFRALKKLPNLTKISLASNSIGTLKEKDFLALVELIKDSNLEYIDLIDNDLYLLDHKNFAKLCDAIESCRNLQYLFILMHNDLLTQDGVKFTMLCNCLLNVYNRNPHARRAESFYLSLPRELTIESNEIKSFTFKMLFDKLNDSPTINGLLFSEESNPLASNLLESSNFILSNEDEVESNNQSNFYFNKCIIS